MCAISALLFSVASGYTYFMYKSLERCFGSINVCYVRVRIYFGRLSKLACIINGPFNPSLYLLCSLPLWIISKMRYSTDFHKGVAGG